MRYVYAAGVCTTAQYIHERSQRFHLTEIKYLQQFFPSQIVFSDDFSIHVCIYESNMPGPVCGDSGLTTILTK